MHADTSMPTNSQSNSLARVRSLATMLTLSLIGLGAAGCAFGEEASSLEDESQLLAYVLGVYADSGATTVNLRLGDGGTDGLTNFVSGSTTVALNSSSWLEIDRLELLIRRAGVLGNRYEALHEEGPAPGPDTARVIVARDVLLQPLAAGAGGSATDSLGRPYFAAQPMQSGLPIGTIERAVLHLRRFQFSGSANGTPFSVLEAKALDAEATLRCATRSNPGQETSVQLYFDYSALFRNLASASQAGIEQAFRDNATNADLLGEHECFQF